MRLCRYLHNHSSPAIGFLDERGIWPLHALLLAHNQRTRSHILPGDCLLDYLPPAGRLRDLARELYAQRDDLARELPQARPYALEDQHLLVPIPEPKKIFLLAGNYAAHVQERGGTTAERDETFPYVFMKPSSTTLTDPGQPVVLPAIAPDAIDWEIELAVVIGRRCKNVPEAEALSVVAGYTIINDISHRQYRPNPGRKKRERDAFFDWLHGKWFDRFCPCGPCITSAETITDPQNLAMHLHVNDQLMQDGSTAQMIFPVAAVIAFISAIVTLEPGDLISTGTPAGVGSARGVYLKPGDRMTASIAGIGTLVTPVVAE